MFLRSIEAFRRLECPSWRRFCLSLGESGGHQGCAPHVHRRAFGIVITHGLFGLCSEPIKFRFFSQDLSQPRPRDRDGEDHREEL